MGELSSHSSLCSELRWNSASEQTSLPFIVRRAGQESLSWLCSVVSDALQLHGLLPRLLCPWHFPGKHTGEGCHFLLQGTFQTQGLNPHLSHWQVDSLLLSHLGSPELLRASLHWSAKWGMMMGNPLPHPGLYQGRLKIKMNPPLDSRGEKK